ncbi:ribosomal RNA small subunit methyltransferase E [Fructobacillus pseudoficulneus]|uniref:Ribosomal RNA small subunit methyltransferase E n=1 Tax=Fructobacillus pseudoficulneus TaxID=220714 RepID=A0A3F3H1Y1_9LACO|nr:RsmE family RNA methyltransferase [Fructobacillus pseudoficulneus]GAP02190.1 ribosomal RNA small subunit methyltransferase E [Fructobacillus pseudoficulneus]SEH36025.1 16S rRNA (uracil1498-N3)-methyltransferase [Fructobacillus pseudoficulneus]
MHRYFLNEEIAEEFTLPAESETYHHLVRVLRAKAGTKAEFVDQQQRLVVGEVMALDEQQAVVSVVEELNQAVELPVAVTLVVSPVKNDRTDWLVQKATEMGVSQIILAKMERTVVDWGKQADKRLTRLHKIALNAAEQSHRLQVPVIRQGTFAEVLSLEKGQGIVAWEESAKHGESATLVQKARQAKAGDHFVAVFGPEGGLSENEIDQLAQAGYEPAGLGPRILRAETAPLYTLAALSTIWELLD